jgi:hypothetical protein
MKKHGQITYELTEEEYNKIKNYLWYIKWFLDGESGYEEDMREKFYEIEEMFDL